MKKTFFTLTMFLTGIFAAWAGGTDNKEEYLFQEWAAAGATFTSVPGEEVSTGTGNTNKSLMLETALFGEHNLNGRFAIVSGATSVAASADHGLTLTYATKNTAIFSVLNLKQGDKVTVKFYSNKNISISSGNVTYTNPNGNTVTLTETGKQNECFDASSTYETTFTMTADGNLDLCTHSSGVTLRIMSVVIEPLPVELEIAGAVTSFPFTTWAAEEGEYTSVLSTEAVTNSTGNAMYVETAQFYGHDLDGRLAFYQDGTLTADATNGLTYTYNQSEGRITPLSILGLKKDERVTVTYYTTASNFCISSGNVSYTDGLGNKVTLTTTGEQTENYLSKDTTVTFTMTADGTLDFFGKLSGSKYIRIKNITIEKSIYDTLFYSAEANDAAIVRKNATAGKFGTICLPFAGVVPENVTAYSIVYKDNDEKPTKLYLEEATALEAGVGYVYKSTDANDICFKAATEGTVEILDTPVTDGKALVGTFTELAPDEEFTGDCYYLLHDDSWVKVGNQFVGQAGAKGYRAYLDLTQVDVLPGTGSISPLMVTMSLPGGATDVEALEVQDGQMGDGVYYTLTGQRVTNPTKGIYIKNGKKVIIK